VGYESGEARSHGLEPRCCCCLAATRGAPRARPRMGRSGVNAPLDRIYRQSPLSTRLPQGCRGAGISRPSSRRDRIGGYYREWRDGRVGGKTAGYYDTLSARRASARRAQIVINLVS